MIILQNAVLCFLVWAFYPLMLFWFGHSGLSIIVLVILEWTSVVRTLLAIALVLNSLSYCWLLVCLGCPDMSPWGILAVAMANLSISLFAYLDGRRQTPELEVTARALLIVTSITVTLQAGSACLLPLLPRAYEPLVRGPAANPWWNWRGQRAMAHGTELHQPRRGSRDLSQLDSLYQVHERLRQENVSKLTTTFSPVSRPILSCCEKAKHPQ